MIFTCYLNGCIPLLAAGIWHKTVGSWHNTNLALALAQDKDKVGTDIVGSPQKKRPGKKIKLATKIENRHFVLFDLFSILKKKREKETRPWPFVLCQQHVISPRHRVLL